MHHLDATPDTVTDVFSRDLAPVLTIDAGDTVRVRTLDCNGHLNRPVEAGAAAAPLVPDLRGHCLTGPIAVRTAAPGAMLAVTMSTLRPDGWGFTVAGGRDTPLNRRLQVDGEPAAWSLWELDVGAGTGTDQRGLSVPLAPFLGVVGVAPAEPGEHSTIPPRPHSGGNIDCRELVAGSTLYLPVNVPGALLFVGDGHAAQGDGEVGGTAVECGMISDLLVDVTTTSPLTSLHAITPTARLTFGFDSDLNEAAAAALDAMLTWLVDLLHLDRAAALGFASTTVDLRVTQIANRTWGVHAVLPHAIVDAIRPA